jgi:hypothetical protein
MSNKLAVVAMTRDEAQIWKTGLDPGTHPEKVKAPDEGIHHHVRTAQFHSGHDSDHMRPEYYEEIAQALKDFGRILLLGHGKGKASATLHLVQYLERKHPDQAKKVVDSLETDLENLSEGQILAIARKWEEAHPL